MTKKELIEALEPYDDDIDIWRYDSTIFVYGSKDGLCEFEIRKVNDQDGNECLEIR